MTKKLAIVGKAPASIPCCPFDDKDVEIWSLSDAYRQIPRWDRWFELHDPEWHRRSHPEHWDFLTKDHGKPLYLLYPHKDIPHATLFPREAIMQRFPAPEFHNHYFTNSISWFLAMAALEGYEWIGLYGVDMAQTSHNESSGVIWEDEYAYQRPSCEYWIGVLNGLGITVHVPGECDLMKCNKLYGYETHNGQMYVKWRARRDELRGRLAQHDASKQEADRQAHFWSGAKQALEQLCSRLNGDSHPLMQEMLNEAATQVNHCVAVRDQNHECSLVLRGAQDDMSWSRQWC